MRTALLNVKKSLFLPQRGEAGELISSFLTKHGHHALSDRRGERRCLELLRKEINTSASLFC